MLLFVMIENKINKPLKIKSDDMCKTHYIFIYLIEIRLGIANLNGLFFWFNIFFLFFFILNFFILIFIFFIIFRFFRFFRLIFSRRYYEIFIIVRQRNFRNRISFCWRFRNRNIRRTFVFSMSFGRFFRNRIMWYWFFWSHICYCNCLNFFFVLRQNTFYIFWFNWLDKLIILFNTLTNPLVVTIM